MEISRFRLVLTARGNTKTFPPPSAVLSTLFLSTLKHSSTMVQDCPICLEPISRPWGVSNPCGHPFHSACWDGHVAALAKKGKGAVCAVCKVPSQGFVPVYMDATDGIGGVQTTPATVQCDQSADGSYKISVAVRLDAAEADGSYKISNISVAVRDNTVRVDVAGEKHRRSST